MMKKFLSSLFLFVVCACAFISCNDDDITLEEMREELVGKWELMDPPTEFYYMEYFIFNSNGTAQMITDLDTGKQVIEATYRLEEDEKSEYLILYLNYADIIDARLIKVFSSQQISMKLGFITQDMPKYYKKVK